MQSEVFVFLKKETLFCLVCLDSRSQCCSAPMQALVLLARLAPVQRIRSARRRITHAGQTLEQWFSFKKKNIYLLLNKVAIDFAFSFLVSAAQISCWLRVRSINRGKIGGKWKNKFPWERKRWERGGRGPKVLFFLFCFSLFLKISSASHYLCALHGRIMGRSYSWGSVQMHLLPHSFGGFSSLLRQ